MLDLITIGDTTVDLFLEIHEASVNCNLDPNECKLVLNYVDKIPVTKMHKTVGAGNAANVAVGVARLGYKTGVYTVVGNDTEGKEVKSALEEEGVGIDWVVEDKERGTNFSAIINFKGERTILSYHEKRDYDLPELEPVKWLYFTSVGQGHEKLQQQVPEYVKESGAKLVFQPGSRQIREGGEHLKSIIGLTDVLIVNTQEAVDILGLQLETRDIKIEALLTKLREWGAKTVVITDGKNGSWGDNGEGSKFEPVAPAKIVDKTGAGDAYAAALVGGLMLGKDLKTAMRWGSVNAAGQIEKLGSREGMLQKEELEKKMKEVYG